MPEADRWGVFADELKILADGGPGAGWWTLYVAQQPGERLTYLAGAPPAGHVHVACDSKDDAETLLATITGHGINPKHVKVATLAACQKAALSVYNQPAPLDAAAVALITALRAAPEGDALWTKEGDAWWIARSAPMDVLMRAGDLLHIPDLDHYSRIALADEVTEAARRPAAAATAGTAAGSPGEMSPGSHTDGSTVSSAPARPGPRHETAAKTTWTSQTTDQLVAALARKGWSRDSVRDACRRAARDGSATVTDTAGDRAALVTFGDTETDLWDATIRPRGDGTLPRGATVPVTAHGRVSAPGGGGGGLPSPGQAAGQGGADLIVASRALARAGSLLAASEKEIRQAAARLNEAIDAAHAAGWPAEAARELSAKLGDIGRAYLAREIRSWDDIYENGPRPLNENDSDLLDLHARPRPDPALLRASWEESVPGDLAAAGQELARAETGFDTAYARFSDASDYAQYAQMAAGQAARAVTAICGPLDDLSRDIVDYEISDWNTSIHLDLAVALADGTEPARFWDAAANARPAKAAGDYGNAAAWWTLARNQLPAGHLLRDGLDSLTRALLSAAAPGQHVTCAGYILHHSTEPASPWSSAQLAESVREHAAALDDGKHALREILDGWSDGEIAAAIDDARSPDEAVARACLFATFERADQAGVQSAQDGLPAQPPRSAAQSCTCLGFPARLTGGVPGPPPPASPRRPTGQPNGPASGRTP